MKKGPHSSRFRPAALVLAGAALCVIVPAIAQVPPPSRDRDRNRPEYVDSADHDRTPYYVDGVEYKPYVPERRPASRPPAEPDRAASQPPATNSQPAQPNLHPYTPPSSAQASAPRPQAAQSTASSAAAPSPYVRKKRPRHGVAIIEALDKISSESVRFEAPIGQPVRYKGLIYTVRACETTADDEPMPDVIAYMHVRTNPVTVNNQPVRSKEIFRGWTYASTPSLNPIEHPIYDAWVIACRKPLNPPAPPAAS